MGREGDDDEEDVVGSAPVVGAGSVDDAVGSAESTDDVAGSAGSTDDVAGSADGVAAGSADVEELVDVSNEEDGGATIVVLLLDEGPAAEADVAADVAAEAPSVATTDGPVGVSSALTQPVFAVRAAGQATWVKETVGLSAPSNQSKRQ